MISAQTGSLLVWQYTLVIRFIVVQGVFVLLFVVSEYEPLFKVKSLYMCKRQNCSVVKTIVLEYYNKIIQ